MNALNALRDKASTGIVALLWLNLALVALRNAFRAEGFDIFSVIATLLIVGTATLSWMKDRTGATTRVVTSMAHAATVAVLVYAFAGSPLQIDIHMYFFASLAICAVWIDWRAIVGYAALVAVHHVLLFFVMPFAIFPGESDFSRVVLHAVVLILQSGVLIALTHSVVSAFLSSEAAVEAATSAERSANESAEHARQADRHPRGVGPGPRRFQHRNAGAGKSDRDHQRKPGQLTVEHAFEHVDAAGRGDLDAREHRGEAQCREQPGQNRKQRPVGRRVDAGRRVAGRGG